MNPPPLPEDELNEASLEKIHSALFEQLITGHAQMALMLLGKLPNLHSGENEEPNLEAAKIFIDQLEMLEVKTKGNRSEPESILLRDVLTRVRTEFATMLEAQLSETGAAAEAPTPSPRGSSAA